MQGIVIKSTGSWYNVKCGNIVYDCKIRGKFRLNELRVTNPLAVGDKVDIELENDGIGLITKIYDRVNYIIRKSANLSHEAQIIAANLDQALLVVTIAFPQTAPEFIDRFLVTSEIYKIPAIIVFNKIDLLNDEQKEYLNQLKNIYEKIGYKCIEISTLKKINLEAITQILKNKTTLISGNSGVGKSSMVNAIDSSLKLKTGEISDYHHKGKHTTTFAEMFELEFGGSIIDTPGIKGFGMVDMEKDDIAHNFPEMFSLLQNCKFYNCLHTHEPGCKVKQAVENGEIAWTRYRSYLSLLEGDDKKHREDDY